MNGTIKHNRSAFTLIEIMVTMTVMAVGLMAVLSSISTLNSARQATVENLRVNALLRTLVDRVQGAQWSDLTTTRLPWSRVRLFEDHSLGNGDALPMTQTDLVTYGLLSQPILTDGSTTELKVYFEYYRAISYRDGNGDAVLGKEGVSEDVSISSVSAAGSVMHSAPKRSLYRLKPTSDVLGLADPDLLGADDPVLIRIVVELSPTRHMEIITGRKL